MSEPKECPKCGKLMLLKDTGYSRPSVPPQYEQHWWCGCGHRELAGWRIPKTYDDMLKAEWEKLNNASH
jgi:hypothetical protein